MTHNGPRWRALLEARWQARLEELTELSLAYHAAADVPDDPGDEPGPQEAQTLLRRAVAARRKLEDVEEALARLAAGTYGRCEQCESPIPAGLLALIPEGGLDLGRLLVLPRTSRREGVRGSAVDRLRGGVRGDGRGQRSGRGDPADRAIPAAVREASCRSPRD